MDSSPEFIPRCAVHVQVGQLGAAGEAPQAFSSKEPLGKSRTLRELFNISSKAFDI